MIMSKSRLYGLFRHATSLLYNSKKDFSIDRLSQVNKIIDKLTEPSTNKTLHDLGLVKNVVVNEGDVRIDLDLLVPGHPHYQSIENESLDAIKTLSWATSCSVSNSSEYAVHSDINQSLSKSCSTSSSSAPTLTDTTARTTARIKHIIGVSSCKGGVGKSTIAVNFAFALAQKGLKVGLLDADIYGPSLPYMVQPVSDIVRRSRINPKNILPLISIDYGIKMLSFGHVNPKAGVQGAGGREAAVLRGPVASKVITQMIVSTEWGELDYLVVDMPPGTGDIQITLSQTLSFAGAVIVTTPHHLSLVDAAKGVAMFQHLKIPTLALVCLLYMIVIIVLYPNICI